MRTYEFRAIRGSLCICQCCLGRQQRMDSWCHFSCFGHAGGLIWPTSLAGVILCVCGVSGAQFKAADVSQIQKVFDGNRCVVMFIFIITEDALCVSTLTWDQRNAIVNRSIFWSTADYHYHREWKLWRSCVKHLSLPAAAVLSGFAAPTSAAAKRLRNGYVPVGIWC